MERQLNWQKYLLLTRFHWKFLMICALGGLALGIIISGLIIKPTSSSHGKLLIKGAKGPTFVTPLGASDMEVRPLTLNGNPLLTQIEVLNSFELAERVIKQLEETVPKKQLVKYKERFPKLFEVENLAKKPKLKNPANTDVVSIRVSTHDREFSNKLVANYMQAYRDFLEEINRETLAQQSQYIRDRIKTTEDQLTAES
jgi:uncharacterized protein involved in exopolysaccharide biosynthesis